MYYSAIITFSITISISRGKNEVNDGNSEPWAYPLTCVQLAVSKIAFPHQMFYTDLAVMTKIRQTLLMLRKATTSCRVLEVPGLQVLTTQKTSH
jgi:hypothetical protein